MEDCIFCKIAAGKIPGDKVYEDEAVFAFRDIHPQAPVHILIIPRKHHASLGDMGEKEEALLGRMLLTASRIALQEGIAGSGYRLIINTGPDGGQVVRHLHLHLLGGRQMDGGMG